MSQGFMLRVPPFLIPHTNKHFFQLKSNPGVRVVTGVNGFIWVDSDEEHFEDMAMLRSSISLLARAGRSVNMSSLDMIIETAKQHGTSPYDMLKEKFIAHLHSSSLL
uniref:K Homology domain-containing protein n=1 Tax=Paramoeba aestuarina TaxID=180227 RepID=A0A7S4JLT9_9EUKA|mmetsp:Transcript_11409/g.17261  ORF Transcript_11409/g.17261 Transcript_11409/m.17261 type:complete len:107 (+) Transcript_11409:310-630(+)|eukprot:CAMPEP_0201536874 /NCGR_PEP_ID=MMETSP0161_2-20130828/63213_1 /ASSEMBLY_ACC=CAM_ASM_000251 /TAXON_ID=180227 /ORGANISM="Neoparamoeba aestuarina, Strain SoJaBio B1-5/56/2" /LENGTH=106 /DNA_ID=CAMNT_0047942857 /DNA_START=305 /DNA_END=625 /DNA_ORIENTATION=-